MRLITKNNINDFLFKYGRLHDASYDWIRYSIKNSEIKVVLNAYDYSGEKPVPVRLIMVFVGVKSFDIDEVFDWNFLQSAIIEQQDDMWVYVDDVNDSYVSVTCSGIYFE
jgi:hypothetical protein